MRILLGMSGGVDSTYAAHLLAEQGHSVEGAVLIMHEDTDLSAARESAASLGIPLHEIDCRAAFAEQVIRPFAAAYRSGLTPNPCVFCNPSVKMGMLYAEMQRDGFDRMATGHYARVSFADGRYAICPAEDPKKDQSYVLYRLPQPLLAALCLPLSGLTKESVRARARAVGIAAVERPESMEICFLPPGQYAAYLTEHFGPMPEGDFVAEDGRVLGRHSGIQNYTVGQRKGLHVALGERMFVTRIDPTTNRITLAPDRDRRVERICVSEFVFSGISPMREGTREFSVRLRYHAPAVRASVSFQGERAEVTLLDEVRAAAPGQSAVFYSDGRVAFGGYILPQ